MEKLFEIGLFGNEYYTLKERVDALLKVYDEFSNFSVSDFYELEKSTKLWSDVGVCMQNTHFYPLQYIMYRVLESICNFLDIHMEYEALIKIRNKGIFIVNKKCYVHGEAYANVPRKVIMLFNRKVKNVYAVKTKPWLQTKKAKYNIEKFLDIGHGIINFYPDAGVVNLPFTSVQWMKFINKGVVALLVKPCDHWKGNVYFEFQFTKVEYQRMMDISEDMPFKIIYKGGEPKRKSKRVDLPNKRLKSSVEYLSHATDSEASSSSEDDGLAQVAEMKDQVDDIEWESNNKVEALKIDLLCQQNKISNQKYANQMQSDHTQLNAAVLQVAKECQQMFTTYQDLYHEDIDPLPSTSNATRNLAWISAACAVSSVGYFLC